MSTTANTITGATSWELGDSSQAARFCGAQTNLTAGQFVVAMNHWDPTVASSNLGPYQNSANHLRITTVGTPTAGQIRVTVFYRQFKIPQS